MNAQRIGGLSIIASISLLGCTIIPEIPYGAALPVREIFMNTACELKQTLQTLDTREFKRFDARNWTIKVSLSPKANADIAPGLGLTRRVPTSTSAVRFTNWAVNSPGVAFDATTQRDSSVGFQFKSGQLIDDKLLNCNEIGPTYHALAQHLRVGRWVAETVKAVSASSSGKLDSQTYNSDITIKFSANGSYTYTFPGATDLASLSGYYRLDEQLNITMTPTPQPKSFVVTTLPVGEQFVKNAANAPNTASFATQQSVQQRLDLIGIQQAIRNLETKLGQ